MEASLCEEDSLSSLEMGCPTSWALLLDTWIWIFCHQFTQLESLNKALTPSVLSIADL